MLEIILNNQPYQIGQPLPESISSCHINYISQFGQMILIPKEQGPVIRQWLLDVISRCTCEYLSINNTLYLVADLPKDKHDS